MDGALTFIHICVTSSQTVLEKTGRLWEHTPKLPRCWWFVEVPVYHHKSLPPPLPHFSIHRLFPHPPLLIIFLKYVLPFETLPSNRCMQRASSTISHPSVHFSLLTVCTYGLIDALTNLSTSSVVITFVSLTVSTVTALVMLVLRLWQDVSNSALTCKPCSK